MVTIVGAAVVVVVVVVVVGSDNDSAGVSSLNVVESRSCSSGSAVVTRSLTGRSVVISATSAPVFLPSGNVGFRVTGSKGLFATVSVSSNFGRSSGIGLTTRAGLAKVVMLSELVSAITVMSSLVYDWRFDDVS